MRREEISRAHRFLNEQVFEYPVSQEVVASLIVDYEGWVDPTDNGLEAVYMAIEKNGLSANSRNRELVYKRAYLYNFIRESFQFSFYLIGQMFGNKDHATVMNGIKTHKDLITVKDKTYAEITNDLKKQFRL